MTDKSLSKQICEICGIKSEIIQDYELNDIEVYPDFENNNNNFVKLGEIKIGNKDYKTIFYLVNYLSDNSWETKEEFLRFLIDILSEDTSYKYYSKLKLSVIKAIRKTNWEY